MKTIFIFLVSVFTLFSSCEKKSSTSEFIDSVYVKVNGIVYLNKPSKIHYKDSLIIFKNDSIVVLMPTKTSIQLFIHDSLISGQMSLMYLEKVMSVKLKQGFNTSIEVVTYQDFKLDRQTSWTNQFAPLLLIGLILFRFLLGSSHKKEQETKPVRSDGNKIVEQLSELGYFKYMNDAEEIDELKKQLVDSINNYNSLITIDSGENFEPIDKRLFFCNGETLFEIGGLEEYLNYIKPSFKSRNLSLECTNEISNQVDNHWSHKITVNAKEYVAFEGDMDNINAWGYAQLNFYEMMNDVLERQNSDEQVYPIYAGEDGQFIFLNKEQFEYIESIELQDEFKPRTISDWKKYHELN
ncbi:MAG: hypothetical protein ACOVP1_00430 [Bacteroidia bacterium]